MRLRPVSVTVLLAVLGAVFWAQACASTARRPRIAGVRPPLGTTREGMASWYGPGYHGKRTSSGEVFDQNALTAAHYNWEFGTRVEVTLLSTGKSAVVRINDRMPRRDRVIDVSKGTARRIGLIGPGVGRVRLKVVGFEP